MEESSSEAGTDDDIPQHGLIEVDSPSTAKVE